MKHVTKLDIVTFQRQAREIIGRIAKDRDRLRELVEQYEDILSSTEDAEDQLTRALDTLSEYL